MKVLFALLLSAGMAVPASVLAAAPVKVASVEGITEYRLGNGLRVLLFPDPSKPTLTTNIIYLVGSRHEHYGETGMAHLLEHLLFKPTANFGIKKGTPTPVDVLNASGADFNGTTWYDRTNYYSTFPASDANLRTMLALEADRMVNAPIAQNDLWNAKANAGEMTVVRNEFELGESDPVAVTTERLQAVAYDWHNYGKSTIGARSDIEKVDINRLRAFYKNYYQPDNAILMVAGRFDQAKVLAQVEALFGRIPKPKRKLQPTYTVEPVQDGERAVTVRRNGGTQFVGAGYHVAPSGHPDAAALALLMHILADAPSGRLHKALVEAKLASRLETNAVSNLEQGYRIIGAVVPKDQALEPAEQALLKVLENLRAEPVTEAEVERARTAALKQIELAVNDTAQMTIALTESMAAGDWRLFFVQRDLIEKLDAKAVQAVAERYFKASNRTVGRFIPTDAPDRAEVPLVPDVAAMVGTYHGRAPVAQGEAFDPSPANIEARTERVALPGGMKAALLPKKTKGATVSVTLELRTGSEAALRGQAEAGSFAAELLMRGSERLSRQQIRDAFDRLKTQVAIGGSAEGMTAALTTTRAKLPAALDLLAEVLRTPVYADSEFAEEQREQASRVEQDIPEPEKVAVNAFLRLLDPTPPGHVRHVATLPEQLVQVRALTVQQVRAFHKRFYGTANATFAAVGDFEAPVLKAQLERLFGNWQAAEPYERMPVQVADVAGKKLVLATPDKANSMLFALQPLALKNDAPAYPALLMANHMLGGGALRSRLADRIRQQDGLSYGVGSQLNVPSRDAAGYWLAYAISAPQNAARVEAALREEVARAVESGFTAAELAEAKKGWQQGEEVVRTDDAALSERLASYLSYGRTMAYEGALAAQVAALTPAQVNAALREWLKPAVISVVSAGDFSKPASGRP